MSRRIRDDFVGVVHIPGLVGVTLKAGDEVPDGIEFGDHLFDPSDTEAADTEAASTDTAAPPAGNASTEVWQAYARSKGATDADLEGKSRDELREQYGA